MVENVAQIKSGITIISGMGVKIQRTSCEKKYIWNPSACTCGNSKYSVSIISSSVITVDKIIEIKKTVPTKFTPTKTISTKTTSSKTVATSFNEKSNL